MVLCDLWYSVMFCGVLVFCGVLCCSVVSCDLWCSVVFCSVLWCGLLWCSVMFHGVLRCSVAAAPFTLQGGSGELLSAVVVLA